uniref:class I SAM-dependent DNA methyltransferase n=1 Tax=Thaumasiovibrio occultus TaxID=1891184 RepID=UPI000D3B0660|nr:class I SAM-dependent methyltransferase [Thaumasiovibrio occultus]
MRHLFLFGDHPLITTSSNALYTDLSGYYDLMCADIDYQAQSHFVRRLHQLFGNGGTSHLDLACGTGPHIRHFVDSGFQCQGLDLNQPMLDRAKLRCPEADFILDDMCAFSVAAPVDVITCFLYSIHYSGTIANLKACIESAHAALAPGGMFCFNVVEKNKIDNRLFVRHGAKHSDGDFMFASGWHYNGEGEKQSLKLSIEKRAGLDTLIWHDEHPMVAVSFEEMTALLEPYFEVTVFEHDYEKILPVGSNAGNAFFACVKK